MKFLMNQSFILFLHLTEISWRFFVYNSDTMAVSHLVLKIMSIASVDWTLSWCNSFRNKWHLILTWCSKKVKKMYRWVAEERKEIKKIEENRFIQLIQTPTTQSYHWMISFFSSILFYTSKQSETTNSSLALFLSHCSSLVEIVLSCF